MHLMSLSLSWVMLHVVTDRGNPITNVDVFKGIAWSAAGMKATQQVLEIIRSHVMIHKGSTRLVVTLICGLTDLLGGFGFLLCWHFGIPSEQ